MFSGWAPANAPAAEYLATLSLEAKCDNGQVYTPQHLVDFVLDRAGYDGSKPARVLDPASGGGAFLEGAVRRIANAVRAGGGSRAEILLRVERELFGVDIDRRACELTIDAVRRVLSDVAPGTLPRRFFASNILCADFLGEQSSRDKFDFIVGNPPYVSATRIDAERKVEFRDRFATASGRLDLYTLFIERAVELLRHSGRLAFITPDKFLISQSARGLRSFLLESTAVRSIARFHSHNVFAKAATVPCVTVFERSDARSDIELMTCEDVVEEQPRVRVLERSTARHTLLSSGPWYLSTSDDVAFARRLQGKHPRLAQFTVRVSAGPATGRDRLFVMRRGSQPDIESELLHPAVRGRDVAAFGIDDPGLDILVPYTFDRAGNASLIDLCPIRARRDTSPIIAPISDDVIACGCGASPGTTYTIAPAETSSSRPRSSCRTSPTRTASPSTTAAIFRSTARTTSCRGPASILTSSSGS